MNIHEVGSIVGLSRKSIRYYEEEGLLCPKRNLSNDYRIYTDSDIKKLKLIKFLRELDVPIIEIKKLDNNTLTIQECMYDRIKKIEEEEKNYKNIKNMCLELASSKSTYNDIDIEKYSSFMNILNKKGFTMRNIKSNKNKKIFGAVTSSVTFSLFFIFLIMMISYFQFTNSEKIPWLLYGFLVVIFLFPLISIIINLFLRIKEINKGEEDEASKY